MLKPMKPAAFATLMFTATIFGANHVAARVAFDHGLGVSTAVAVRSLATALVVGLLVWRAWARGGLRLHYTPRQAKVMVAIALLVALQSLTLYGAVARIPVALALLTFNLYSLSAVVWSRALYGGRVSRHVLLTMPVMFAGLALALDVMGAASGLGARGQWDVMGEGVLLALVAAFSFGLVLALTQHEVAALDGRVRSAFTMLVVGLLALAGALLWPAMQGGDVGSLQWPHGDDAAAGWWGLLFLALFYGSAFTIMFTILPRLGAVGNSPIMNIEPVMALFMAWLVLGQAVGPMQLAGAVLVVGCVMSLGFRRA